TTGLMMKGKELLARSLVVIDKEGVVRYLQVVPEVTHLPDIAHAIKIANELVAQ
ncbi:thiol peroxidase, partial [PVC group bacterium]|nr:thiol peroxidase [PVC group bacterium]